MVGSKIQILLERGRVIPLRDSRVSSVQPQGYTGSPSAESPSLTIPNTRVKLCLNMLNNLNSNSEEACQQRQLNDTPDPMGLSPLHSGG